MIDVDNLNPLNRYLLKKDPADPQPTEQSKEVESTVRRSTKGKTSKGLKLPHLSITQFFVVLPVVLSAIYFYGVARDRYVTRSDFVIRKAETADAMASSGTGGLAALLGQNNQASLEDARYLKTYLQSPQVLADLRKTFSIDKEYKKQGLDPFAGIDTRVSHEKQLVFFKKQVAVTLDEISGAIILRTVGLDPKSSLNLNRFMLAKSVQFVNRLNQDISLKQMSFAELELKRSRGILERSKNNLVAYQNANNTTNPKAEAEFASAAIAKMQEKLVELTVELSTMRRKYKDPNEPEVMGLADEVQEIKKQIDVERRSLVSKQGRNLNQKAADLVRLESDVSFASDMYRLALNSVEKARVESKRQQKFMALLSAPQLPEDPQNDWRTKGFFTVLAASLVSFSLAKFVLGMQASHRQ
jgi:capsular polysaccharide transport system permease protein